MHILPLYVYEIESSLVLGNVLNIWYAFPFIIVTKKKLYEIASVIAIL